MYIEDNGLKKEIGFLFVFIFVIGIIIGLGVFMKSGVVFVYLGDLKIVFFVWLLGGILILVGGLIIVEIGM